MIAIYIILGLYYLLNAVVFSIIHFKKTQIENKSSFNDNRMVSFMTDNNSVNERLLDDFE